MIFTDMLTKLRIIKKIDKLIRGNPILFSAFIDVYLFGSVLSENCIPNDLDILLVYEGDVTRVLERVSDIRIIFEKEIGLIVDMTVLSREEVIETDFLERINYLKVK